MARGRTKSSPETPAQLEPGSLVDGYRVERVLSAGTNYCELVQAVAPDGARVALKVLGERPEADDLELALRVARRRASIDHPHLLKLLKAGEHDGRLYLVSELRGTRSLADRLSEGRMPADQALPLAAGVAGALSAAAAARLVHAELSPQSILVVEEDPTHALLTDFGIGREPSRPEALRMNLDGVDYRSPEELKGGPPKPESNAYSLACVLFECLTGATPFRYDRPLLTLHAHLVEPPPRPSAVCSDLPGELDEVFVHAMAKEPGQRLGSAALVASVARVLGVDVEIPAGAPVAPAREPRAAAPAPRKRPAVRASKPARAKKPSRAERRARAAERARTERPARTEPPTRSEPPKRVEQPARAQEPARAEKRLPAPKPARTRKPKPAAKPARTARPAHATKRIRNEKPARTRSRRGSTRARPALVVVLMALAVSAVAGYSLGTSGPAAEPAPASSTPSPRPADSAQLAQAEYVRSVSPVIDRLSARRAGARRRLRQARLPGSQAAAARALASAYADAGQAISGAASTTPEGTRLRAQLRSAERSYRRLAAAARTGNGRAWRSASRAAVEHERRFERSLLTLTTA